MIENEEEEIKHEPKYDLPVPKLTIPETKTSIPLLSFGA